MPISFLYLDNEESLVNCSIKLFYSLQAQNRDLDEPQITSQTVHYYFSPFIMVLSRHKFYTKLCCLMPLVNLNSIELSFTYRPLIDSSQGFCEDCVIVWVGKFNICYMLFQCNIYFFYCRIYFSHLYCLDLLFWRSWVFCYDYLYIVTNRWATWLLLTLSTI